MNKRRNTTSHTSEEWMLVAFSIPDKLYADLPISSEYGMGMVIAKLLSDETEAHD
jgi:hypothetical protein